MLTSIGRATDLTRHIGCFAKCNHMGSSLIFIYYIILYCIWLVLKLAGPNCQISVFSADTLKGRVNALPYCYLITDAGLCP